MAVVRTVVTSLPKTTAKDKTYRIDPAPEAPSGPSETGEAREAVVKPAVVLGTSILTVDLVRLLADLDAESRRLIGPSAPPRG